MHRVDEEQMSKRGTEQLDRTEGPAHLGGIEVFWDI